MAGPYKRVGADDDGLFPPRVMEALDDRYIVSEYSPPPRADIEYTTPSIAQYTRHSGLIELGAQYQISQVKLNYAGRIRLYPAASFRTNDAGRPTGVDPQHGVDHGVLLDVAMNAAGTLHMSPVIDGYVDSGTSAYLLIDNLDTVARAIKATLTYRST